MYVKDLISLDIDQALSIPTNMHSNIQISFKMKLKRSDGWDFQSAFKCTCLFIKGQQRSSLTNGRLNENPQFPIHQPLLNL